MKFVGLDGLSHFWSKAKTWIINRITTEVTAKIAQIIAEAPEDLDTLKEIADWISSHANDAAAMNTAISTNTSDIATLKTTVAGKSDTGHTHTKSQITDFPTSLPANGGKSAKSSFLDEYVGAGGTRPTSGNIIPKDATEYGGMRKDVVTSSMTDSGRPGQDGHLLTMFWDNSGRHDSQVFVSNEKQPTKVKVRVKANEADYGPWVDLITSQNIGSQTVASAGTAAAILDYNRGTPIKVRWDGPGIDSAEWYPAFNADGSAIEPISRNNIHVGTADKAVEVVDYGDASRTVKVGYKGPGVTADKLLHLAGYTEQEGNSVKIKDVNKEELIKWLGIPRIKYADYQTPTQAFTQFQQVPIELSKFSPEVTPNNVLCFMVIYWTGVQLIASGDWGSAASSGLKCALIALQAGTGSATIRCVYMV